MAQRFKGILFDTIGTIVIEKQPDVVMNCFRHAFESEGVVVTPNDISSIRGQDKSKAIAELLTRHGYDERLTISVLKKFKAYFESRLGDFQETTHLEKLIVHLRHHHVLIGVGTGLPSDLFKLLQDHLRWEKYKFDFMGISDEIGFSRPHPAMIDLMRQRFGINKEEFLKIGDTVSDVQEGKNAGVKTAALLAGTQSADIIRKQDPDFIFENLSELASLF